MPSFRAILSNLPSIRAILSNPYLELKLGRQRWRQYWEISRIRKDFAAAKDKAQRVELNKRRRAVEQEIYRLRLQREELRTGARPRTEPQPLIGALPDFVIIGGKKCGTSFLYYLLSQHPLVEPAARKEVHFFDDYFEEGVEWYRRFFRAPRLEDGQRVITGEASPGYLYDRSVPQRMAEVVPQARLVALLRNPVDRAFSDYQMTVRLGREWRSFEQAIDVPPNKYLPRGVYADQLLRWSEFFSREQLLILKSEDFFERPADVFKIVLGFLELPEWEFDASRIGPDELRAGGYEQRMDPATRRRLEEYFEPHNRRLYDFLGTDFGW